jgi:hypothetical protein
VEPAGGVYRGSAQLAFSTDCGTVDEVTLDGFVLDRVVEATLHCSDITTAHVEVTGIDVDLSGAVDVEGSGSSYADCTTLPPSPYYEYTGCCCFVPNHVLDLGTTFPAGARLAITWQPGTPGSSCPGGTMYFDASLDKGTWTSIDAVAFPSISGHSYPRTTTAETAPIRFRYVKVEPSGCYVDYSSVKVN